MSQNSSAAARIVISPWTLQHTPLRKLHTQTKAKPRKTYPESKIKMCTYNEYKCIRAGCTWKEYSVTRCKSYDYETQICSAFLTFAFTTKKVVCQSCNWEIDGWICLLCTLVVQNRKDWSDREDWQGVFLFVCVCYFRSWYQCFWENKKVWARYR